MVKFWIDFSGSCSVYAKNEEEARLFFERWVDVVSDITIEPSINDLDFDHTEFEKAEEDDNIGISDD